MPIVVLIGFKLRVLYLKLEIIIDLNLQQLSIHSYVKLISTGYILEI